MVVSYDMQELCYYGIFTLFYFIAAVVSAVNGYRDGAVVAATVSIYTYTITAHLCSHAL